MQGAHDLAHGNGVAAYREHFDVPDAAALEYGLPPHIALVELAQGVAYACLA